MPKSEDPPVTVHSHCSIPIQIVSASEKKQLDIAVEPNQNQKQNRNQNRTVCTHPKYPFITGSELPKSGDAPISTRNYKLYGQSVLVVSCM